MFCRYVAGCKLKFNYNWKTACTFADYDRSVRLPPPKGQTARRDGSRVYSYDFKPALNICFGKKTSEITSEIAAEFGFFPVSIKMKAQ